MKLTEKQCQNIVQNLHDKGFDFEAWAVLSKINKCFMCKHKEKMFNNKDGCVALNGKYLFHLFGVHGIPPENAVEMIASQLYSTKEGQDKMIKSYN